MSTVIRTPDAELLRLALINEHRRIERGLEGLLRVLGGGAAIPVSLSAVDLARAVEAHFLAEERFLFPLLEEIDPAEIAALFAEHQHLRRHLVDLDVALEHSLVHHEVARALIDASRAHYRREEALLIRWSAWLLAVPVRRRALEWLAAN